MAVADDGTVLVVERSGVGPISGARLVPAGGEAIALPEPLPLLRNPWPVALDDGFAIGGLRCITEPTSDEAATDEGLMCTNPGEEAVGEAEPYVVFLDARGEIEAEVAGPVGNPSGTSFQGASESVHTTFGFDPGTAEPVPYRADENGFERMTAPPGSSYFCELPDGSLLSAGPPEDGSPHDTTIVRVQSPGQDDWREVAPDLPDGTGSGLSCVPGGLVGPLGLIGENLEWHGEREPSAAGIETSSALAIVGPTDVVVIDHDTGTVATVDWITGVTVRTLAENVELAAVSPDRSKLAVLADGEVRVVDV